MYVLNERYVLNKNVNAYTKYVECEYIGVTMFWRCSATYITAIIVY